MRMMWLFLDGQLWTELLSLEGRIPKTETVLAWFMVAPPGTPDAIKSFTEFLATCVQSSTLPSPISNQWQGGIARYCEQLSSLADDAFSELPARHRMGLVLEELHLQGYSPALGAEAHCRYNAGDLQDAIRCWDASDDTSHQRYYLAQAQLKPYPAASSLAKAGESDKIYASGRPTVE